MAEGQRFTIFNGGPHYQLNPAFSMYVSCETQAEVDALWAKLLDGCGQETRWGWLVDRFGLSWQVIPSVLPRRSILPGWRLLLRREGVHAKPSRELLVGRGIGILG